MTLVPPQLPAYVFRDGEQVYRPPYTARKATIDGFVVDADDDAIAALLAHDLVAPSQNTLDYRCAHASVVFAFAHIDELTSTDLPDSQRGHVPEWELSVWCLAVDKTADEQLVWYLPYVFCDSGQTVATGREVYGYPKQLGTFDGVLPMDLPAGATTAVEAVTLDPWGPQTAGQSRLMASITRPPAPGNPPLAPDPNGLDVSGELDLLFPGPLLATASANSSPAPQGNLVITSPNDPDPVFQGTVNFPAQPILSGLNAATLLNTRDDLILAMVADPMLVFLKQFRDVQCPTKACYQAIIEAPISVDPMGATYQAFRADQFQLRVGDWASHRLATTLGLAPSQPITPRRAFRATLAFEVQLGEEIWRRP